MAVLKNIGAFQQSGTNIGAFGVAEEAPALGAVPVDGGWDLGAVTALGPPEATAVDIPASLDVLTITEQPATVQANVDTDVAANADALVLAEQPATVQANVDTDVVANFDSLTISEQPAVVQGAGDPVILDFGDEDHDWTETGLQLDGIYFKV
jgi:hypothetical protein